MKSAWIQNCRLMDISFYSAGTAENLLRLGVFLIQLTRNIFLFSYSSAFSVNHRSSPYSAIFFLIQRYFSTFSKFFLILRVFPESAKLSLFINSVFFIMFVGPADGPNWSTLPKNFKDNFLTQNRLNVNHPDTKLILHPCKTPSSTITIPRIHTLHFLIKKMNSLSRYAKKSWKSRRKTHRNFSVLIFANDLPHTII